MSILILNGRTSRTKPNQDLLINRHDRFEPPIINGLMSTDIAINGLDRLPVLSGCVLNLPLYHPLLSPSSIKSLDANQHVGTVHGALWTPGGRIFDGDDDITVADSALWDFGTGDFTWSIWVKLTGAGVQGILSLIPEATRFVMYSYNNAMNLWDAIGSANHGWGDITIPDNTWGYYTLRRTSGILSMAKNGNFSATTSSCATDVTGRTGVSLGWSGLGGSEYLIGTMGEALIHNLALANAKVVQSYLATKWRYL